MTATILDEEARLTQLLNRKRAMTKMRTSKKEAPLHEDLFVWANLSPVRTGLPFVVWIAPKVDAPHDVRVKVSRSPTLMERSDLVAVAIRPDVHIVGDSGDFSEHDVALL